MGNDPDRYLGLIGPHETEAMRHSMSTMSGCGLIIRGMWRELGLDEDRLFGPYKIGQAITDLIRIARENDALRRKGELPCAGDVVLVGGPPGCGGTEHVFTVIDAPPCFDERGKARLVSVDGGQKDELGRQTIKRKERVWSLVNGSIWDSTSNHWDGPAQAVGRKVILVVDCLKLAFPWNDDPTDPDIKLPAV